MYTYIFFSDDNKEKLIGMEKHDSYRDMDFCVQEGKWYFQMILIVILCLFPLLTIDNNL